MSLNFQGKSTKDNDVHCKKILLSDAKCSILYSQMPANVIKIITETDKILSLQSREISLFPNAVDPSWLHHVFAFSTHWLVWGLGEKLGISIAWQRHRWVLETVSSTLKTKAKPTDLGKECEIICRKWKKVDNWEIAVMLMDYDTANEKGMNMLLMAAY